MSVYGEVSAINHPIKNKRQVASRAFGKLEDDNLAAWRHIYKFEKETSKARF
jgi:hypothetical protein